MAEKKKSADLKIRKKKWVQIIAPFFNDQMIGETHVYETAEAMGKTVDINLMYLVNDPRKQNTHVSFKTTQLKGDTAVLADITGLQVQEPSLRKLVRRGKTKVTASFKTYSADNVPVVIKFFAVTRTMVNVTVAQKLRRVIKQALLQRVAAQSFNAFMQAVIQNAVAKEVKGLVDKIHPLRVLELYSISIVPAGIGVFEKPSGELSSQQSEESSEEASGEEESERGVSQIDEIEAAQKAKEAGQSTEEVAEETTEEVEETEKEAEEENK